MTIVCEGSVFTDFPFFLNDTNIIGIARQDNPRFNRPYTGIDLFSWSQKKYRLNAKTTND